MFGSALAWLEPLSQAVPVMAMMKMVGATLVGLGVLPKPALLIAMMMFEPVW